LVDGSPSSYAKVAAGVVASEISLTFDFNMETSIDMFGFKTSAGSRSNDPAMWKLEATNDLNAPFQSIHRTPEPLVYLPEGRSSLLAVYPNQLARSHCGIDKSGCKFGQTFAGTTTDTHYIFANYSSWLECQRFCCYDSRGAEQRCTIP